MLHILHFYINDIPSTENDSNIAVSMCADEVCQCSIRQPKHRDYTFEIKKIGLLETGLQKWKIKINIYKSSITLFSNQTGIRGYSLSIQQVKYFNEARNVPENQNILR
jgi:hypothetical protein